MVLIFVNLNNDNYRQLLISSINQIGDYQLQIAGSFDLDISTAIKLSATKVSLQSKTNNELVKLNNIDIVWQLAPLLDGIIHIEHLNSSGVSILQTESTDTNSDFSFTSHYFLPSLHIKSININNATIHAKKYNKNIVIDGLNIKNINHQDPFVINSTGTITDHPFSIKGKIGSLSKLLSNQPFSIDIQIKTQDLSLSLKGSTNPLNIKNNNFQGTDIALHAQAPTSLLITDLLGIKAGDLGPVNLTAQIISNNSQLQLENILLTAGRKNTPSVVAKGSIKDLFNLSEISINASLNEKLIYPLLSIPTKHTLPTTSNIIISDKSGNIGIEIISFKAQNNNDLNINFKGSIDNISNMTGISINYYSSIDNLAYLNRFFYVDYPESLPINFQGQFQGVFEKVLLKSQMTINNTKINSQLTLLNIREKSKKMSVTGFITIPTLYIEDLKLKKYKKGPVNITKTGNPTKKILFNRKPFSLDWIPGFDINVHINIENVKGTDFPIKKIDMNILLADNVFKINSAKFIYAKGEINADASITKSDIPLVTLKLTGNDINIKGILMQSIKPPPIEGDLNLSIDLSGKGYSAHQVVSSLNGEIGMTLEDGTLRKRSFDALFLDIIDWMFTFGVTENTTKINCAMINYKITQGQLNTNIFSIDGPDLSARGRISIDLSTETIDAMVNIEKRQLLFSSKTPMRLTGKLSNPDIQILPHKQGIFNIGSYFFIPFVRIPTELLGPVINLLFEKSNHGSCQDKILPYNKNTAKKLH